MPLLLVAELVATLTAFRMVVAPVVASFVLTSLYLGSNATPSAELAMLILSAGLGFGLYKLLWVPDPRRLAEDAANQTAGVQAG